MKNHILYICYGDKKYYLEAAFSTLTLLAREHSVEFDITIAVDDASKIHELLGEDVPDLVHVRELDRTLLESFVADGYVYRIKPLVIQWLCVNEWGGAGKVLFLDGDTYVYSDVGPYFQDLERGWILNFCEGVAENSRLKSKELELYHLFLSNDLLVSGKHYPLDRFTCLWNSGVIGFQLCQLDIVDEWIAVMNAMRGRIGIHTVEQIALSIVLWKKRVATFSSENLVFHYCNYKEFRSDIDAFFLQFACAPISKKLHWAVQLDPATRVMPKLRFDQMPKHWRSLRKRIGWRWKAHPFPWVIGE